MVIRAVCFVSTIDNNCTGLFRVFFWFLLSLLLNFVIWFVLVLSYFCLLRFLSHLLSYDICLLHLFWLLFRNCWNVYWKYRNYFLVNLFCLFILFLLILRYLYLRLNYFLANCYRNRRLNRLFSCLINFLNFYFLLFNSAAVYCWGSFRFFDFHLLLFLLNLLITFILL